MSGLFGSNSDRVRNWSGALRKLTADQYQRELARWDAVVGERETWRNAQVARAARACNYSDSQAVLAAWGLNA